ncbi:MAG TPA: DUF2298 domain-containing protein, partial [Roseiflexaceae bacterium]|nr:DUF2298 domain-containing protein [Roseiflexaceae bacterium]
IVASLGIQRRRSLAGIAATPWYAGFAPAAWRTDLLAWLRARRGMLLGYEVIFALALVFAALLRSYQPDPWGTERPMDYAFFNAITRSPAFPPHDPWMAGLSINYYYFGYLLMAVVQLVAGAPPAAAYNLSLALVFALAALGIAGVLYNLIGLSRNARGIAAGRIGRWGAITATVILVLCGGNLGGALQIASGTPMVLALEAPDMARAVANGLGSRATITLDPPFRGEYFDGTAQITPSDQARDFNWWNPSRALWEASGGRAGDQPYRRYAITEFPFFSFWLGDMHPHVMSLPFVLLALALGLQMAARPQPPAFAVGSSGWGELLLVGIIIGCLYTINSWDLPTGVLLGAGGLLLGIRRTTVLAEPPQPMAWRSLAIQIALILTAAVILFLPFHLTFRSLVGGKEPLVDLPILATITRTIGLVLWDKTDLHALLIIFGLFLLPLVPFVLRQAIGASRILLWAVPITLLVGMVAGFPLLFLLPLGMLALERAYEEREQPALAFALGSIALGCAICLGTEIIYIRDVFESRMNTIFKFYYQVWLIWGTLAGFAAWWLFAQVFSRRNPFGYLFGVLLIAWAAAALVYPWHTAGRSFREGRMIGLVGQTPRDRVLGGPQAIDWLRANTRGDEVILEASGQGPGESYDPTGLGIGGVSAASGLATVLGWPGHQQQWRAGDPERLAQIEPRRQDVVTIYSTLDLAVAQALLDRYNVVYVYIGQAERTLYAPESLAKFAQLGEEVYAAGEVVIYRVR